MEETSNPLWRDTATAIFDLFEHLIGYPPDSERLLKDIVVKEGIEGKEIFRQVYLQLRVVVYVPVSRGATVNDLIAHAYYALKREDIDEIPDDSPAPPE